MVLERGGRQGLCPGQGDVRLEVVAQGGGQVVGAHVGPLQQLLHLGKTGLGEVFDEDDGRHARHHPQAGQHGPGGGATGGGRVRDVYYNAIVQSHKRTHA